MAVAVTEERLRRLAESGLRGSCRTSDRVSQLRRRSRGPDDRTLKRMTSVFSGLADHTRLRIMHLLAREELCACELMTALELTQPTTSHHLGILERSGLVTARREGKWIFYKHANPEVESLLRRASSLARRAS